MKYQCKQSPCLTCLRVRDPEECENKACKLWQNWFLAQWAILHSYPRRMMDAPRQRLGVWVGGECYAHPVQVDGYLQNDPCSQCRCSADLCKVPCRARQNWGKAQEVTQ